MIPAERFREALPTPWPEDRIVVVQDVESAFREIGERSFDIVVADSSVSDDHGISLLEGIKQSSPASLRILLADKADRENALRVSALAHQVVSHSPDLSALAEAIGRLLRVRGRLHSDAMERVLRGISQLPALPQVYSRLVQILADPEADMTDIARIVEQDPAITVRALRLVNSAFFALPRRINRIQPALIYLGINTVKSLVLSLEVFRPTGPMERVTSFSLPQEQRHALLTSSTASGILGDKELADEVFLAGLLHDFGKLVLATHFPDRWEMALRFAQEENRPLHVVEKDHFGVTHADIGGHVLSLWGLPSRVVEAVTLHHDPGCIHGNRFDVLDAIQVADVLVMEAEESRLFDEHLDLARLKKLGVTANLSDWREVASRIASKGIPDLS